MTVLQIRIEGLRELQGRFNKAGKELATVVIGRAAGETRGTVNKEWAAQIREIYNVKAAGTITKNITVRGDNEGLVATMYFRGGIRLNQFQLQGGLTPGGTPLSVLINKQKGRKQITNAFRPKRNRGIVHQRTTDSPYPISRNLKTLSTATMTKDDPILGAITEKIADRFSAMLVRNVNKVLAGF